MQLTPQAQRRMLTIRSNLSLLLGWNDTFVLEYTEESYYSIPEMLVNQVYKIVLITITDRSS